jgi:hypothetical protein
MSDEPKMHTRAWFLWALIAVLLLVYPLSLGPAAWLAKVSNTGIDDHHSVYAPIFWLGRQSPDVEQAIESYMRAWRR